jgi:hypothetical protein
MASNYDVHSPSGNENASEYKLSHKWKKVERTFMNRFHLSPSYTRVYRGLGVDRILESMHTKCTEEWRASFRTVPKSSLSNLTSKKHFFFYINVKYVGLLRMDFVPSVNFIWKYRDSCNSSCLINFYLSYSLCISLNRTCCNTFKFSYREFTTVSLTVFVHEAVFTYHFAVDNFSQPTGNYLCIVVVFFLC